MENQLIGEIQKSDFSKIQVNITKRNSSNRIDARLWVKNDDKSEYVATRKGITLLKEEIDELTSLLKRAGNAL